MTADRELKDGWRWVRFGDVVREVKDTTKDPEADQLTRVVGLEHLDSESLPLRRWNELADLGDGTSFTRVFRAGQVLFGKRRAYQRKVAVADFDGICSSDILVLEPSTNGLLPEFLPYLVQSDGFFEHALGTSAGSLSPRTKFKELAKYEFALPPVDEQRRIVAVLSAATTTVDRAISIETAVTHMKAAVVDAAIWSASGRDWTVPLVPVGELLAEGPRNGVSPPAGDEIVATLRSVSISAVQAGRFVVDRSTEKWVLPVANSEQFRVRVGDLFAVRGNGNRELVGKVGMAEVEPKPACVFPDLLIRLRFDTSRIEPELATAIWNSPRVHRRLLDRAKSSNGIYKVNGKDIRSHMLPVPPEEARVRLLQHLRAVEVTLAEAAGHQRHAVLLLSRLREHLLHEERK